MQILGTSAVTNTGLAQAQAATTGTGSSNSTNGTGSSSSTNSVGSLTSEQTFLQLLVAQIQNQDPLNPTDSIQFVGQLVSYSQLEQLMEINQGITTLTGDATSTSSTNGTSTASPNQNPTTQTNGTSSL
jgi:flagellar basal-body rod modification protein FlgD